MTDLMACSSISTGGRPDFSPTFSRAAYTIDSAFDFLPSVMSRLMSCVTSFDP